MDLSEVTLLCVIGTTDRLGGAEKAFRAIANGLRSELGMTLKVFSHLQPHEPDSDFEVTVLRNPEGASLGRLFRNLRSELLEFEGPGILFPFQINSNMLAVGVNQSLPKGRRFPTILNDRACIDELLAATAEASWSGRILSPVRRELALRAYRQADRVVCNARGNERAVLRFADLDPERVSTIYNPLAVSEIQARFPARDRSSLGDSQAPLLATHARMSEQKGLDTLLRAFARVRERYPGARLRIVGDGPERASLEALAHELGVVSACEFPGFLSDPLAAIEEADLYVLSSRWEGLPNSLLEAIGVGLPVVSTRCPTGPDEILLEGEVGRLIAVDDVEAMSREIVDLLSDDALREGFARKSRERAKDFSLDRSVAAYKRLMMELLEERG
ncbi:MAG: glycosyltransferase [Myxococcota bacterium]|nr:glycosyltransferase [Myxococcota bacterium]